MAKLEQDLSQAIVSVKPRAAIEKPEGAQFVQITRHGGLMLGGRWCAEGEVLSITPADQATGRIMPVDDRLFPDRARQLVTRGFVKYHPGPATHDCESAHSKFTRDPKRYPQGFELGIRTPAMKGAEQATTQRGKGGGAL